MALLCSRANGNWLDAATWAVVDATSYQPAEAGSEILTTAYSGTRSSAFTPGAIEIDGIGVKLSVRSGVTGTISVNLELDADDSQVAGTEVTIDCADLPAAVTANADGGWIFFKFAAPVTLAGATAYQVAAKTSSASQVSLFRDGTADNISRFLRTTTTQAPTTGDDVIVAGEYTAAGASTTLTVTMNETAATDYGAAPTAANSLLTPGIAVCGKGVLTWGTTAATNYLLRVSNSIIVYLAGTWNQGTTGTPMPRDSTAILELDPAADGDYGFLNRGGTVSVQGLSRTSGKNIVSCKLNTDEAVNQTTLGVDTDTGWLDNDQIAVASTTRTASQSEVGTLNGNASATELTVDGFAGAGGGLAAAHSGTSPTQAEVILLTRNVKVRSVTSTIMAYCYFGPQSVSDIDWAEFYYLGENATNKRGIEVGTTTGSFNMQFSSLHDCEDNGLYLTGATLNNVTYSSNMMWNLSTAAGPGCQIAAATSGTSITISGNILIKAGASNVGWTLNDVGGVFTNNTVVSAANAGITLQEDAAIGTQSGNVSHSNAGAGLSSSMARGVIASLANWRNTTSGVAVSAAVFDLTFDTLVTFGNTTSDFSFTQGGTIWLKNWTGNGDTSFATTNGMNFNITNGRLTLFLDNCDLSTVAGIKTAYTNDIALATSEELFITMRNTKLGAATEISNLAGMTNLGFISSQKHDQTAGNHKTWMRYGTLATDATISNTAAPSMRMTPNNASGKLESAPLFQGVKIAVANGAALTVSAYTRKSASGDGAAYNGNEPRLIVRANPALGIATDTVLDTHTAAVGTWEQVSGTTATVTDDGVLEFVVDCDGTAGWVNVDDWAVTGDPGGAQGAQKYWFNGLPIPTVVAAAAGGGSKGKLSGLLS